MTTHAPSLSLGAWIFAMRPWSLTASAVPVCLGTALAWQVGSLHGGLFVLVLLGGVALQVATNFMNTYGDFLSGVDTVESAVTCPQLVTGQVTPHTMFRAGLVAFAVAVVAAVALAAAVGWPMLVYALLGMAGGYYYTNGRYPYKYHRLGPLFVFVLMGPLMVCPAYFVQTGSNSLTPFFVSLSISCLVTAIMHGNDIRDISHDRAAGIRTLAMSLGRDASLRLFAWLYYGAYAVIAVGVAARVLPLLALLPVVLLPALRATLVAIRRDDCDVTFLEGWAAKFHLQFGLALIAGLLLSHFFFPLGD